MFSPYYAKARKVGLADANPFDHCSLNVALYGPGVRRWTMTERNSDAIEQHPAGIAIGPSAVHWDGAKLVVEIDETTALSRADVRGTVTLEPELLTEFTGFLDSGKRHAWYPAIPRAHVTVSLDSPALSWSGPGYLDMNRGQDPLEHAFSLWNWSRAPLKKGAAILYDVHPKDGKQLALGLHIRGDGAVSPLDLPPVSHLPRTPLWRMPRETRSDYHAIPTVIKTLEDTPFYSRSMVYSRLLGEPMIAMHESLSLDRFTSPLVQRMLPYRMPRV